MILSSRFRRPAPPPQMIDVDESGDLEKQEIVVAVKSNQKVIKFLVNCGEPNLQNLLVPSRLEAALAAMDTDNDGHVDIDEWEECIEVALANKLAERAAKRELEAKQANKEIEEFTNDFKNAARKCFQMIDKDGGGTLSTDEIVTAVKEDKVANPASYDRAPFNLRGLRGTAVFVCLVCGGAGTTERPLHTSRRSQEVIDFLKNCGEENLQFLLHPPRLKKALEVLDEDGSGEIDIEEWRVLRRP